MDASLRRPDRRAWVLQDVGNSAFATTILAVLYPLFYREVLGRGASGSSVLAGRKNKGAIAYRELASALLKHWKTGKPLPTFTPEV